MDIAAVQKSAWSFVLDETRVLVADDDPILLEFAIVHLSSPTAVIETAPDGATALAMLKGSRFDIALLDISMPGLDGFGLLAKIRADADLRHMPVMMLTGHEDIASIDRAYSLGANSFATKPVNWRLLSYHIRYVLRTSKVERELRRAHQPADCHDELRSHGQKTAKAAQPAIVEARCGGGAHDGGNDTLKPTKVPQQGTGRRESASASTPEARLLFPPSRLPRSPL